MADVTQSQVTIVKAWSEGGVNGKRRKTVIARLAGTWTAGSSANKIPAALFTMKVIESCKMGVLDDNSRTFLLTPSYDGSMLLATDMNQVTDANRNQPADITVTTPRILQVEVSGYGL